MGPTSRFSDLLEGAAADLLDMRSPLSTEFLVAHNVTLDECLSLSELIGHILRGYVYSPVLVQNNLFLAGVLVGAGVTGMTAPTGLTGEDLFQASLDTHPHARPAKRMQSLLKHLATDFLAERETFSHEFLVRHAVKADECFQLSEYAGYLIRGYNHAANVIRNTVLICGIAGKSIPGELVFTAGLQVDIQRKLAAWNAAHATPTHSV